MRFKLLAVTFVAISSLGLAGCNFFLKHQSQEKPAGMELKAGAMSCLRDVPTTVRSWLSDQSTEAQIKETFNCLRATIDHFEKFTRGKTRPDWYADEELLSFLNEVLKSENKLAPQFMHEVLKFKTLALGGTADGMSLQEIRASRKLMDILEKGLLLNRENVRYLLFQGGGVQRTVEQERKIQRDLQTSILEILQLNPKGSQSYSFSDFQLLVEQFNLYLGDARILAQFLRWFPFSQSIKSLFVGTDPEIENEKAWFDYVQWGMRAYGMALDFFYNIRTQSFEKPEHWDAAILWVNNIFEWIDVSPAMTRKGFLQMNSVNEVLDEVLKSGLFKVEIEPGLVVETACRAILNLFDGPSGHRRQCFELEALSIQHYKFLKFEWNTWMLAQKQINKSFSKGTATTWGAFRQDLQSFDIHEVLAPLQLRDAERTALRQTYAEWRQTIEGAIPVVWDADNRLSVRKGLDTNQVGFAGTTLSNTTRSVTRFILRGYGQGTGTNIYTYKISPESFLNLENDFQKIGVAIRFLDSRGGSSAKRTFKEANFLTYSGNGDNELNAQELFEVINILASAGHQIANQIYNKSAASGCATGQFDQAFGKPYLKEDCYRQVFRDHFRDFFKSAPGLVSLSMNLSGSKVLKRMEQDLFDLSRTEFSVKNQVEFSEVRTMVAVLLYAEVLRVVYDTDGSLTLSRDEVRKAAPRFAKFIAENSPFGNYASESIFMCLIFQQRKPTWSSVSCLTNPLFGSDKVMVPELVKVLAVLKQDMIK